MAYTPPLGNAIEFNLASPYAPPYGGSVDFNLSGDVATFYVSAGGELSFQGNLLGQIGTSVIGDGAVQFYGEATTLDFYSTFAEGAIPLGGDTLLDYFLPVFSIRGRGAVPLSGLLSAATPIPVSIVFAGAIPLGGAGVLQHITQETAIESAGAIAINGGALGAIGAAAAGAGVLVISGSAMSPLWIIGEGQLLISGDAVANRLHLIDGDGALALGGWAGGETSAPYFLAGNGVVLLTGAGLIVAYDPPIDDPVPGVYVLHHTPVHTSIYHREVVHVLH